jgi:cell division protease FtsH
MSSKSPKSPRDKRDPESEPEETGLNTRLLWIFLVVTLVVVAVIQIGSTAIRGETKIPYSELKQKIHEGDVEKVLIRGRMIVATPTEEALGEVRAEESDSPIDFQAWSSFRVEGDESLIPLLEDNNIEYDAKPQEDCSEGTSLLFFLVFPLLLLFFFFNWSRRMNMGGPANPAMSFGKSKAKLNMEEGTGVTFEDVAGCDEAKQELEEIVQFLKQTD